MTQYNNMPSAADSICDLRSDTVTRPNAAMREAMATAKVGDDVYGEDPTVNELEQTAAELTGKEAGLLLSTGTQGNLAALMAHCARGEEIIVGDNYHVYIDEAHGASVLGSIALYPVATETGGEILPDTVRAAIKPDDSHFAISRLLCLENTVHGQAIPLQTLQPTAAVAREHGLKIHLDGARFFNAVTELGCTPKEMADVCDSVSLCLSKGLGAPMGSVLVGDKDFIHRARRIRKMLGGGTRQAGIIAAAGLHALRHNLATLGVDHRRARLLGQALHDMNAGAVRVCTNMVFLSPDPAHYGKLQSFLSEQGVTIANQQPEIRLVVHRDIDDERLLFIIDRFEHYFSQPTAAE